MPRFKLSRVKGVLVAVALSPVAAFAQTSGGSGDVDLSGLATIGAGLSVAAVVTAIVAMGTIKLGPGFARWATNKVATFFR